MRKVVALALVALVSATAAVAQSNQFMDTLLASKQLDFGQASYLVLVASDNIGEDADAPRAFELLGSMGWAPEDATLETPVTLAQFSFMLMKAFGLRGGLMYRLFPGPRYAYRELRSVAVIQGRSDPGMAVDGSAAVRMLGRVFDVKGVSE